MNEYEQLGEAVAYWQFNMRQYYETDVLSEGFTVEAKVRPADMFSHPNELWWHATCHKTRDEKWLAPVVTLEVPEGGFQRTFVKA